MDNTPTVLQWMRAHGLQLNTEKDGRGGARVTITHDGPGPRLLASFNDTPLGVFQTELEGLLQLRIGGGVVSTLAQRGFSFRETRAACADVLGQSVTTLEQFGEAMDMHKASLVIDQDAKVANFATLVTAPENCELVEAGVPAQDAYVQAAFPRATRITHHGNQVWDLKGRVERPDLEAMAETIGPLVEGPLTADGGEPANIVQACVAAEPAVEESTDDEEAEGDDPRCRQIAAATHIIKRWMVQDYNLPAVKAELTRMQRALRPITTRMKKRIAAIMPKEPLPVKDYVAAFREEAIDHGLFDMGAPADCLAYNVMSRKGAIAYNPNTGIISPQN